MTNELATCAVVALVSSLVTFLACAFYSCTLLLSDAESRAVADAVKLFRARDGEKNPRSYRLGKLLDRHGCINAVAAQEWREQHGWIAVSERLPDERVDVLVSSQYAEEVPHSCDAQHVCQRIGENWLEGVEHNRIECVTHWRFLPESPEEKP